MINLTVRQRVAGFLGLGALALAACGPVHDRGNVAAAPQSSGPVVTASLDPAQQKAQRLAGPPPLIPALPAMAPRRARLSCTPTSPPGQVFQGPEPPFAFSFYCEWGGPFEGRWLTVLSGTKFLDGNRGNPVPALKLETQALDPNLSNTPDYSLGDLVAPRGGRGLRIAGVTGEVMQLTGDDGSVLTFNIRTHQFS